MRSLHLLSLSAVVVGCLVFAALQHDLVSNRELPQPPITAEPRQTVEGRASPLNRKGEPEAPMPTLAAMFLSWYGYDAATGQCLGGLGSTHWNDTPNTGGVVDVPVRGYYCSADPEVVSWQLGVLEDMGVRALFVSWWGWGDTHLDGIADGHADMHMNRGITALLEGIAARQSPIRVALIVEPFTLTQARIEPQTLTPSQRQMVMDWLWQEYYGPESKYHNVMFRWEGSPLLLAFDPMRLPSDARYTVRQWTGRERNDETRSEGWDWFFAPPQDTVEAMSNDGVAFVYPRFDERPAKEMGADYIFWDPRSIDPSLSEGHYERQWQELGNERKRNPSRVRMVVVYGWNHYGEQAHIEPSSGGEGQPGVEWDYARGTKRYFQSLIDGLDMLRH